MATSGWVSEPGRSPSLAVVLGQSLHLIVHKLRAGRGFTALLVCLGLLTLAATADLPLVSLGAPSPDGIAAAVVPSARIVADTVAATPFVAPELRLQVDEFTIYAPPALVEPAPVLLVLHGMGGSGDDLANAFRADAQRNGWIVVAPTFNYGDWWSPAGLIREARAQLPRIADLLDRLPQITGVATRPKALVYGYSRGGQTANRFALAYPGRVAGVAILSAGTYTVPAASFARNGIDAPLSFPYGVSDLSGVAGTSFDPLAFASVPFWIGVGAEDANPDDVPDEWDPYIGRNRVERAGRFADWVRRTGASVEVQLFPGVSHGFVEAEQTAALRFLTMVS